MRFVLTGPESSGKTTLATALSDHFKFPLAQEMSRHYLNSISRDYIESDLLEIAKLQVEEERAQCVDHCICDTDLLTVLVWSNYRYHKVDAWIAKQLTNLNDRHYFLCSPDIPWEPDPLRENPHDRDVLFSIYQHELDIRNTPYTVIQGDHEQRMDLACSILEKLIV